MRITLLALWFPPAWIVAALSAWLGGLLSHAGTGDPPVRKYTNLERLALPRLKAVHEDVQKLMGQRVTLPVRGGLRDLICILHAHAEDSAHTGGTLPEMAADAHKAGVSVILLGDHFRPPRDFMEERRRGINEGVLFIPGSEVRGFLAHPMSSILAKMSQPDREFVSTVTAGEGLLFLSHIEERPDYPMEGLTGLEIYNRHWDAKKDVASLVGLATKLTDPLTVAELEEAVRLYPDALLGFQCDYPRVYLEKWDAETRTRRLTGIAANDCHHNQIYLVKMVDEETVLLGTNVDRDDKMRRITADLRPGIRAMTRGRRPGDVLVRLDMDPYYRSFRNVSTHVWAPEVTEGAVRAALKAGRAYVAHDWMCPASGFDFAAVGSDGKGAGTMGDEMKLSAGLVLTARLPVSAYVRLLCQGQEVARAENESNFSFPLAGRSPGAYRLEAWLKLDGELRPWIFSNPIYVR